MKRTLDVVAWAIRVACFVVVAVLFAACIGGLAYAFVKDESQVRLMVAVFAAMGVTYGFARAVTWAFERGASRPHEGRADG